MVNRVVIINIVSVSDTLIAIKIFNENKILILDQNKIAIFINPTLSLYNNK